MPSRTVITVVAALVVLTYGIALALQGFTIDTRFVRPFGAATLVAGAGLLAFDSYLWRLPGLRRLLGKRPVLQGTWRGALESLYVDPTTQERIPPDPEVYFVIRQRFWSISTQLITAKSRSESVSAQLDRLPDGRFRLLSIYRNDPRQEQRPVSPIHHGALLLWVSQSPTLRLSGSYWTDRRTTGDLVLDQRLKGLADDFASARQLPVVA